MNEVELPLLPVVVAMEEAGYPVDVDHFHRLRAQLEPQIEEVKTSIQSIAGAGFNPNSGPQVGGLLFGTLGLESKKETASGAQSTDGETLELLRDRHRVVPMLLRFRELNKILTTYCRIPDQVDADGRLRVEFNQLAADTGRFSSPSVIQTLPKDDQFGIRNAFRASAGHLIVGADFSQQELNILAQVSGDRNMLAALTDGVDLHGLAAVKVFALDCAANEVKAKHPEKRAQVKVIQFGLLYGKSAHSLARDLNIAVEAAQKLLEDYFRQFPAVQKLIEGVHQAVVRDGYVDDCFGRRRQLPDAQRRIPRKKFSRMSDEEKAILRAVEAAKREAQNFVIQGAAATITKLAMIRCHRHITTDHPDIKLILTLHDELHFEVPAPLVDHFAAELPELMCNLNLERFGLKVPLAVEVKAGAAWGTMAPWKANHESTNPTQ
jgi:DNA polymerase-1